MLKKVFFVAICSVFLSGISLGTAVAENNHFLERSTSISSEAGNWDFTFNSPQTKADIAAQNYEYDYEALAAVSTEAGDWEYDFDAPVTKADIAAQNYEYDQQKLAAVSTEAGDWQFNFPNTGDAVADAVAGEPETKDTVCKGC